eukprot:gene7505-8782_t
MNISAISELKRAVIPLGKRSLLRVGGADAVKLVQGLTSNNLNRLVDCQAPAPVSIYTGFLSSTGRLMFDAIVSLEPGAHIQSAAGSVITNQPPALLIDVDSAVAERAAGHLKYYKMRDKATIDNVTSDYSVLSVLDRTYKSVRNDSLFVHLKEEKCTVMMDPRHDVMGLRILVPSSKSSVKGDVLSNFPEAQEDVYHLYRAQWGIPEGEKDYGYNSVIPLEYNFDLLNGVDFHKGCYLGQELTSRTHYTGLIRKRVFPVAMSSDKPSSPSSKEHHLLFSHIVINSLGTAAPATDSELKITKVAHEPQSPPSHATAQANAASAAFLTTNAHGNSNAASASEKTSEKSSEKTSERASRVAEKLLSSYGNVGLAMIKVDHIDGANFNSTKIKDTQGRSLELLEPCWWGKVVGLVAPTQQVS